MCIVLNMLLVMWSDACVKMNDMTQWCWQVVGECWTLTTCHQFYQAWLQPRMNSHGPLMTFHHHSCVQLSLTCIPGDYSHCSTSNIFHRFVTYVHEKHLAGTSGFISQLWNVSTVLATWTYTCLLCILRCVTEWSIHGKFCLTWSTDSTLEHSINSLDSGQWWSTSSTRLN